MLMIVGVHLLGLVCVAVLMIPALATGPPRRRGARIRVPTMAGAAVQARTPKPPAPPGGGIPLPDADQARVRLRDHRRLGDHLPARPRRPVREPEREPVRAG